MFEKNRLSLSVPEILSWADAQKQRTGRWPKAISGLVIDGPLGLNWRKVDNALRYGFFGLEGGSTLAKLLAAERGVRNVQDLPPLEESQVLVWADRHRCRTGAWPTEEAGPVLDAPGEIWKNVDAALRQGLRSFPGRSSLAKLIARGRKVRNKASIPRLTIDKILALAHVHHRRTGKWPHLDSGPVRGARGETWAAFDAALRLGARGLTGASSLARLFAEKRGVPNKSNLPRLSTRKIREWARAYRDRHGSWPSAASGVVLESGDTWNSVNQALTLGQRGLRGGTTLAKLLRTGPRRKNSNFARQSKA
jgi:hypothetical protein